MINFKFTVTNPYTDRFECLYINSGKIPIKNKFWEIQIMKTDDIVSIDLQITHRTDHPGLSLDLALFGYSITLQIYDNRHWNITEGYN